MYYIVLQCITLYYIMNFDIIISYTLYYLILHYITLYYLILHYITLYYIILYNIILHYISYTLFYHVIWLSSQSHPTIKPFCCSFGVNFAPEQTIRPTTNPIAAVLRFSFFFESDRNRPFGRRFETTTEIFWMLVSEVEEATTNNNEEMLGVCSRKTWRRAFPRSRVSI